MGTFDFNGIVACLLSMGMFCTTDPKIIVKHSDDVKLSVLAEMKLTTDHPEMVDECFQDGHAFQYCFVSTRKGWKVWDKQMNEPYQVYWFDNGPDYEADGLYRIRQDNKIGYASARTGLIRISAEYDCAFPFEKGQAFVGTGCQEKKDGRGHSYWVGGSWQVINKQGIVLKRRINNPYHPDK